jgi:hypothetical protein
LGQAVIERRYSSIPIAYRRTKAGELTEVGTETDSISMNAEYSPGSIARWAGWLVDLLQSFSAVLVAVLGLVLIHTDGVPGAVVLGYVVAIFAGVVLFLIVLLFGMKGNTLSDELLVGLPLIAVLTVVVNVIAGVMAAAFG